MLWCPTGFDFCPNQVQVCTPQGTPVVYGIYSYRAICTVDSRSMKSIILAIHNCKRFNSHCTLYGFQCRANWRHHMVFRLVKDSAHKTIYSLVVWWAPLYKAPNECLEKHMSSLLVSINIYASWYTYSSTSSTFHFELRPVYRGKEEEGAHQVRLHQGWTDANVSIPVRNLFSEISTTAKPALFLLQWSNLKRMEAWVEISLACLSR